METCFDDIDSRILSNTAYRDKILTMIFMTDGEPTASDIISKTDAFALKLDTARSDTNVNIRSRVYTVGFSSSQNVEFMTKLTNAGSQEGRFYYVEPDDSTTTTALTTALSSAITTA